MATRVEQQLLAFAAALRSGPGRAPALLLLGWLLVAQSLLFLHTVDHAKTEKGAPCALCVAGDQLAAGVAPAAHPLPPSLPETVAVTGAGAAAPAFCAAYRSRAPPAYLPG
jgi:hypothetical protein